MMDPDRFPLACLIRRERTSRAWSMERLAMAVNEAAARERTHCGSNRQTVCNWERGQVPHPDTLRWIAAGLGIPVERLAEARAVQVRLTRRQLLGHAAVAGGAFVLPGAAGGLTMSGWTVLGSRHRVDPDVVEHLRSFRWVLADEDNLLGSRHLIVTVSERIMLIEGLRRNAPGSLRADLLQVGASYAQFAGWLHRNVGRPVDAMWWHDRAIEWAQEADDQLLVSHVLIQKAQQAMDTGDGATTVGLARAAQRNDDLTFRVRALAAQHEGSGHALAGDMTASQRKFDEARELLARGGGRDHVSSALAAHCTEKYVEAQRATAFRELGEPERAVSLFERELALWPSHYHRDRGFFLSQLALAHAASGDPEQAAAAGQEAVRIVQGTGCARTLSRLTELDGRLAEHGALPAVRELREALAATA